jgi:hypothetical protein
LAIRLPEETTTTTLYAVRDQPGLGRLLFDPPAKSRRWATFPPRCKATQGCW